MPRHALTQIYWDPTDTFFCAVLKSGFIQVGKKEKRTLVVVDAFGFFESTSADKFVFSDL